jgi:hypothetical protein
VLTFACSFVCYGVRASRRSFWLNPSFQTDLGMTETNAQYHLRMADAQKLPPLRTRVWIWLQVHWGSIVIGAIGLLGFVCVAVGLGIAVDEGNSTVVMIAGVVLIALALLGPDIEEAQFRGRNWAAMVRRITAKANQLSASPDATDDLKKQIEELKSEVLRAIPRRRTRRSKPAATEYETFHTWTGGDEFDVTLVGVDGLVHGARCHITGPSELAAYAPSDPLVALAIPAGVTVEYTYPKEFADARPLVPGRYIYRWSLVQNPESTTTTSIRSATKKSSASLLEAAAAR